MSWFQFLRGTRENAFGIGDGVNSDKSIEANIPGANKPVLRFNHTTSKWQYSNDGTTFSDLSSGGGGGATQAIHQASHGFAVGNILYLAAGVYTKARADAVATAEVVGIVSAVAAGTDDFTILSVGYVSGLTGLTAGTVYFLDPSTAGAMTATEPTTEGQVSKPVFIADSTTSGYFFNMRGAVVGGGSTSYAKTFTNTDLATGILTVTHNFGHQYCAVVVIDNNGKVIIPDDITYSSTTALAVDLSSYGVLSGTWIILVFDSGATTGLNWASAAQIMAGTAGVIVAPDQLAACNFWLQNQIFS